MSEAYCLHEGKNKKKATYTHPTQNHKKMLFSIQLALTFKTF